LEKGGKQLLEPGKSTVTIGRSGMSIQLHLKKPTEDREKKGEPTSELENGMLCSVLHFASLLSAKDIAIHCLPDK
jgi:hypothetical protein